MDAAGVEALLLLPFAFLTGGFSRKAAAASRARGLCAAKRTLDAGTGFHRISEESEGDVQVPGCPAVAFHAGLQTAAGVR
jgi:hypothetical protein